MQARYLFRATRAPARSFGHRRPLPTVARLLHVESCALVDAGRGKPRPYRGFGYRGIRIYNRCVAANPKISEFIERARANGASDPSIVGVLTARGWPEKEVYEVLAVAYERLTGIEIPRRGSAGAAAKDAFSYLLVFSTLTTWTFGLGWLAFTLIDGKPPKRRSNDLKSVVASAGKPLLHAGRSENGRKSLRLASKFEKRVASAARPASEVASFR